MAQHDAIKIRGARTHNLKNIDIDILATNSSSSQAYQAQANPA